MSTTAPTSPWHDSVAPGAGREYTFGQLVKIAMRQLWRNKWRLLGIALTVAALIAVVDIAAQLGTDMLRQLTFSPSQAKWLMTVVHLAFSIIGNSIVVLLTTPMVEGYKWATIRSFDRPRMSWADLLAPYRSPWRGPTFLLALTLVAVNAAWYAALYAWYFAFSASSGGSTSLFAGQLIPMVSAYGGYIVFSFLLAATTLMVGPAMLSSRQPKLRSGLRENWRILRGQPRRMLAIVAFHSGVPSLIVIAMGFATRAILLSLLSGGGPGIYWLLDLWPVLRTVAHVTLMLLPTAVSLHLVAVLFRSAYGLPLEPQTPEFLPTMPMPDVRPAQPPVGDQPQREATP